MAEIVNLRRARKAKAKVERDAAAAENRRAFGRTKAEKTKEEAERRQSESRLDGHKREDGKP